MEGGAYTSNPIQFELSDIGDYKSTDDLLVIGNASIFSLLLVTIATRIGGLGGVPLNTYFDMFGLEGILSNAMLLIILIQFARYVYTSLYTAYGKAWSPFVFLCVVGIVQGLHDVFMYYGVINVVPPGINEMVDAIRMYAKEFTFKASAGHVILIIATSIFAMLINDMNILTRLLFIGGILYIFPYIISIVGKKPPVVKPPPPQKEEIKDYRGF
jgi:hypothetical protein